MLMMQEGLRRYESSNTVPESLAKSRLSQDISDYYLEENSEDDSEEFSVFRSEDGSDDDPELYHSDRSTYFNNLNKVDQLQYLMSLTKRKISEIDRKRHDSYLRELLGYSSVILNVRKKSIELERDDSDDSETEEEPLKDTYNIKRRGNSVYNERYLGVNGYDFEQEEKDRSATKEAEEVEEAREKDEESCVDQWADLYGSEGYEVDEDNEDYDDYNDENDNEKFNEDNNEKDEEKENRDPEGDSNTNDDSWEDIDVANDEEESTSLSSVFDTTPEDSETLGSESNNSEPLESIPGTDSELLSEGEINFNPIVFFVRLFPSRLPFFDRNVNGRVVNEREVSDSDELTEILRLLGNVEIDSDNDSDGDDEEEANFADVEDEGEDEGEEEEEEEEEEDEAGQAGQAHGRFMRRIFGRAQPVIEPRQSTPAKTLRERALRNEFSRQVRDQLGMSYDTFISIISRLDSMGIRLKQELSTSSTMHSIHTVVRQTLYETTVYANQVNNTLYAEQPVVFMSSLFVILARYSERRGLT